MLIEFISKCPVAADGIHTCVYYKGDRADIPDTIAQDLINADIAKISGVEISGVESSILESIETPEKMKVRRR